MPPRLKIVAEEILMCGLKSIPVAGKAFEVIDAVRSRHSMLAHGERLEEIERQMNRVDRRVRAVVEEEIRITLQRLGERSISFGSRGDPCCSRKCLPLKMIPASRLVVRT